MRARLFAVVVASLGAFCACHGCGGTSRGRITASGSSTVFPLTEAMAEDFGRAERVQVTVGVTGTGGGFKKFCAGDAEIVSASRPIKPAEVEACARGGVEYVELPVAYDGIVVAVNPRNGWASDITPAELKKLWEPEAQGKVLRWNQVRAAWPDREIHLFGLGTDSGTYDYFTEAIVGKEHSSRGDYTAAVDPNVLASGIAGDENALGFFGMAYLEPNRDKLKALAVDSGAGPVRPSDQTVRNGTYRPLSRPVFIYVSKGALARSEVASFVRFYLERATDMAARLGFVALPPRAYELARERVERRQAGSVFGGKGAQVGVSIEKLLEMESPAPGR